MVLKIRKATTQDIPVIREITFKVWPQTYASIISREQIDYMLNMMYSEASLAEQMTNLQHDFILVYEEEVPVAFASYSPIDNNSWKLHKLYLLPSHHGKGIGKMIIDHIVQDIQKSGATSLLLNVNRQNPALHFYQKTGFNIIKTEDIDIGNGYFMNDYVMEKKWETNGPPSELLE